MVKVLLTGGNGFIAAHLLELLLERGYDVVTTVRSEDRGEQILEKHRGLPSGRLSYVVVDDITEEGAMDQAVVSNPPFDHVLHAASPFTQVFTDPVKDILDPALKGTLGTLESIRTHAPSVKRVVVLSSFAALLNIAALNTGEFYDESSWNPVTWAAAAANPRLTYAGSKTLAEKAAWDFVETKKPSFDLVSINPPLVLGPVVHHLASLDRLNTSNHRVRDLMLGNHKTGDLPPTGVFLWIDVRDAAMALVRAIEAPEAGGQRFLVTAGYFSNKKIVDAIRKTHPELADKLPGDVVDDTPATVYRYDASKASEVLGLQYRSFNESIGDTVESLASLGAGREAVPN